MKTEYVKYHTFLLNWLHAFSMEELLVILFRNSIWLITLKGVQFHSVLLSIPFTDTLFVKLANFRGVRKYICREVMYYISV